MTPQEIYDKRFRIVTDQLTVIISLLEVHKDRQAQDPDSWDFVGDLCRLTDDLIPVIDYLNGGVK